MEKLEKMQKEATEKAQETILEKQRENESQFYPGSNSGIHRINCAYLEYNFLINVTNVTSSILSLVTSYFRY